MAMTHKQRIENALALKTCDRIPYSMWMHFPNRDRHPRRLAELSMANQKRYDLDFIKFMPFGMYSTIDYGMNLDLFPGYNDAPVGHEPLITCAKDWDKIHYVKGTSGEYAVVLEAQRLLFEMMDERIPFMQTLFSPLTTAVKMCSSAEALVQHLKEDPVRVHRALEIITQTTLEFAKASAALGADGFFYATQMSSKKLLTVAEHDEFAKKYDLEILDAVKGTSWFNVLHIHGADVLIKEMQDYPVQALSWHDRDDGPSMEEVRGYSNKAFVGGLSWGKNWLSKKKEEVAQEVREVAARQGGKGIILGPGCVIDPATPEEFLNLVHATVLESACQR